MFTDRIRMPARAQDTLGGLSRSLAASETQRSDEGLVNRCRGCSPRPGRASRAGGSG